VPRHLDNWIAGWNYYLKESEAPDNYLFWAAISAIAGATQRRIWTKWLYYTYYPNMYIVLVGPPGIVHKSSTIHHVRRMLREIGVATASESLTREAFIKQMQTRGVEGASAITALPDELSDFIRPSGHTMVEFLTSIYGSPDEWEYTTLGRGNDLLVKPFVNFLAGTTPKWISQEFDIAFVEQGFASRTLFVHELKPRFYKAFATITPDMERMYQLLVEDLLHISQLEGEFVWQKDAIEWFTHWYEVVLPAELERHDYKIKGYLARKPTHLLKLAMVLQLAVSDELIITAERFQQSKMLLDNLETSMTNTFSAVGRNIYANDMERIYKEIIEAGSLSYKEIQRRNYHAMDKGKLDEVLESLQLMGYIRVSVNASKEIIYIPEDQ
jgi:hypothetical protein